MHTLSQKQNPRKDEAEKLKEKMPLEIHLVELDRNGYTGMKNKKRGETFAFRKMFHIFNGE